MNKSHKKVVVFTQTLGGFFGKKPQKIIMHEKSFVFGISKLAILLLYNKK